MSVPPSTRYSTKSPTRLSRPAVAMMSPETASFAQSDFFKKGVPDPRVTRHGAPAYKPTVQKGQELWRTVQKYAVTKKFVNGRQPNRYDYRKLKPDEIRLLQLHPESNHTEPIICTMFKAKRRDVVDGYEALSYSWGDIPPIHHTIMIEDRNPPQIEPKKDLLQAIVRDAYSLEKAKKQRREKRMRELKALLSQPLIEADREDREKIQAEYTTLKDLEQVGKEINELREPWDAWESSKNDKTVDGGKRKKEDETLSQRRKELKDKREELERRCYEMYQEVPNEVGESSYINERLTERREKILASTQANAQGAFPSTIHKFLVRPNLYAAMIHLRRAEKPVNLWIDAICINQQEDGEVEKEEQLSVMAEIYSGASNVCIWLGEGSVQLDAALNFAKRIMDFSQLDSLFVKPDSQHGHRSLGSPTSAEHRDSVRAVTSATDWSHESWYYLLQLLRLPWFSRRWIIQEIGMAKGASVHLGTEIIHWDDLCDAINILNEKADHLRDTTRDHDGFDDIEGLSASTLVRVIGNACRKDGRGNVKMKLLTIETLVCSLLAFDSYYAHDAIYSLLSLAADIDPEEESKDAAFTIQANFKRSTRDLFISFVRRSIQQTKSLDIICRHWAPLVENAVDKPMIMPSWVSSMDHSPFGKTSHAHGRQHGENFVGFYHGESRRRYKASKNMEPTWSIKTMDSLKNSPISPRQSEIKHEAAQPSGSGGKNDNLMPQHRAEEAIVRTPIASREKYPMKTTLRGPSALPVRVKSEYLRSFTEDYNHPESPSKTTEDHANAIARAAASKKRIPQPLNLPSQPYDRRGRGTDMSANKDLLSGVLTAKGFCMGTVEDVSGAMDGVVEGRWVKKLGWISAEQNENFVPDMLWRILVADRGPDGSFAPHWYRRACLHVLTDPKITDSGGYIKVNKYTTKILNDLTAQYLRRVNAVTMKRCLFSTTSVFDPEVKFGLAPEDTRSKDLVCILLGCSVPVILRLFSGGVREDGAEYTLVGEAYVHGAMQGEAVEAWKKIGGEETTFHIG